MKKEYRSGIAALLAVFAYASSLAQTLEVGEGCQYRTISSAIAAIPQPNTNAVRIVVKPGVYRETVEIPRYVDNVQIVAAHPHSVRIVSDRNSQNTPQGVQQAALMVGGDGFSAVGLDIQNISGLASVQTRSKAMDKTTALQVYGDRAIFRDCSFYGHKGVLYLHGRNGKNSRAAFDKCLIEGASDVVYGGMVALFERCTIRSLYRGALTMPSTDKNQPFGFVFTDCTIIAEEGNSCVLARPWRPYAKSVFVRPYLDKGMNPSLWLIRGEPGSDGYDTSWFGIVAPHGPAAGSIRKLEWCHYGEDEWSAYLREHGCESERDILKGDDGWASEYEGADSSMPPPFIEETKANQQFIVRILKDSANKPYWLRVVSLKGGIYRFTNDARFASEAFRVKDGVTEFDTRRGVTYDFERMNAE